MPPTRPQGLGLAALALAAGVAAAPPVAGEHGDLTCGAAAIATLLNGQCGRQVTERQVTVAMLRKTNPVLVRARLGFSLLDLKRYAVAQGLEARGYSGLS